MERSGHSGPSRVYASLSSVAFHYRLKGLPSLTDDPRVKMFMKGLKRRNAVTHQAKRATPMTLEILNEAARLLDDTTSIKIWRTVWRMHVAFFCFLRFDDLRRLTIEDVQADSNSDGPYYRVRLSFGKTNQLNQSAHRIISSTGGPSCPYQITQR